MSTESMTTIEVRLTSEELRDRLLHDVATGLSAESKSIPSTWFYDEVGSNLFDKITRLEEYYQTRTERDLLASRAAEIVSTTGARCLIELGSGTCEKTRVLLDELRKRSQLNAIIPIDISAEMLERSVKELRREYPSAFVQGLVLDFDGALAELPAFAQRLVAFLGGTIGNLRPGERATFFRGLSTQLRAGDWFLLGCDLVKDSERLVAAYNDNQGVTAQFNRNVLAVINRELGADFDLEAFSHVALWNEEERWIEMRLRSLRDQSVVIADLELVVPFREGEEIRTEISAKFTVEEIRSELREAGLATEAVWTDDHDDFALVLARPMQD